ncbi:hypothetical protein [Pyrococcus kukulkanii]|uniref:hypothetical protein n=1 Tax=Pyrococcus kukulkanii TaxID=1609559 RepID=UPI00356A4AEE
MMGRVFEIAWIETFSTLDEPIFSLGTVYISFRSLGWLTLAGFLVLAGNHLGGPKINGVLPAYGIPFYALAAVFAAFALIPYRSVKFEYMMGYALAYYYARFKEYVQKKLEERRVKKNASRQEPSGLEEKVELVDGENKEAKSRKRGLKLFSKLSRKKKQGEVKKNE